MLHEYYSYSYGIVSIGLNYEPAENVDYNGYKTFTNYSYSLVRTAGVKYDTDHILNKSLSLMYDYQ